MSVRRVSFLIIALFIVTFGIASCDSLAPAPTPTDLPTLPPPTGLAALLTDTATPAPIIAATPTATIAPTQTLAPTAAPSATAASTVASTAISPTETISGTVGTPAPAGTPCFG